MTIEDKQKLSGKILGALIGLVMSCESNPPTENTTPIIIEGILAAGGSASFGYKANPDAAEPTKDTIQNHMCDDEVAEQYLRNLIDRIHEEKFTIVPNCRTCASPCGNTSDYNMDRIKERSREKQEANKRLMERLYRIALDLPENVDDENAFVLYQGLAAISFDWEPEELDEIGAE